MLEGDKILVPVGHYITDAVSVRPVDAMLVRLRDAQGVRTHPAIPARCIGMPRPSKETESGEAFGGGGGCPALNSRSVENSPVDTQHLF